MSNSRDDPVNHHPVEGEDWRSAMEDMSGDTYRSIAVMPAPGASNIPGLDSGAANFWPEELAPRDNFFQNAKKDVWGGFEDNVPDKLSAMPFGNLSLSATPFSPTMPFAQDTTAASLRFNTNSVRQLKAIPSHFEKYTSFFSRSEAGVVQEAVCEILKGMVDVDFTFNQSKNKIKALARNPMQSGRSSFVVKVYRHNDAERLVEFQRRDGCVVTFNHIYRRTLDQLGNHFLRRACSPVGSTELLAPLAFVTPDLSLPKLSDSNDKDEFDVQSLLKKLCEEAHCEFIDSQRQALCALAHVTTAAENRCQLVAAEAVAVLRKALSSNDDVVLENACRFLVNVCSQETFREGIVQQLSAELFFVLEAPGSIESCASKRHVAKAFAILSSKPCHASLLKAHTNVLSRFSQYHDQCLKENITVTLAQIEAA